MADPVDVTNEIEPLLASVETFMSASQAQRTRLLAQIRDQLGKLRAADQDSWVALEELHKRTSGGSAVSANAAKIALKSHKEESASLEALLPRVLSLQRYLIDTSPDEDPEAYRLLQKAVDIAVGYVAGYRNLRDQLIKYAAAEPTIREVVRARPVEGKVDFAELSREHMARYPKIRAALARK